MNPVKSWQVRCAGRAGELTLTADALTLRFENESEITTWTHADVVGFPTAYSVELTSAGEVTAIGFASTSEQRAFRSAFAADSPEDSAVTGPESHVVGSANTVSPTGHRSANPVSSSAGGASPSSPRAGQNDAELPYYLLIVGLLLGVIAGVLLGFYVSSGAEATLSSDGEAPNPALLIFGLFAAAASQVFTAIGIVAIGVKLGLRAAR